MVKRSVFINTVLMVSVIFFSCIPIPSDNEKLECNNLFLVYMAGDNSLNKTVYEDLEEMKQGLSTENDIILVLADRYASDFFEDEWNEARLLEISFTGSQIQVRELEDNALGISLEWLDDDIDTGKKETFLNFLRYAENHYSSQNLYLDLWNHGGGWKSGKAYEESNIHTARSICYDEKTKNSLSLKDISSAVKDSGIGHFDTVLMDACYMGAIEVAAELIELTDTVIFSQDAIPEEGMPYNEVIPVLFSKKAIDEKCQLICNSYTQNYNTQNVTISAVRRDEGKKMKELVEAFNSSMISLDSFDTIKNRRNYTSEFFDDVVDMEMLLTDEMKLKYEEVFIKNNSATSSGISIYFPEYFSYAKASWEYESERLSFLKFCPNYLDFLKRFEMAFSSAKTTDNYEPNNYQIDSFVINSDKKEIASYLWCTGDEDWYKFELKDGNPVSRLKLYEPEFIEYNLQVLLYKNGRFIDSVNEDEQNEVDLSYYDYDELYVKVYSAFGYYEQEEKYVLRW